VTTTRGGVMHPQVRPGQRVKRGQAVALITEVTGDVREGVVAPADGIVWVMFPRRVVTAGSVVCSAWLTEQDESGQ